MTDIEMVHLCAQAMGLPLLKAYTDEHLLYKPGGSWRGFMYSKHGDREYLFTQSGGYDPLHNDEQAMALVKALRLDIEPQDERWMVSVWTGDGRRRANWEYDESLNRAIVKCAATATKSTPDRGGVQK